MIWIQDINKIKASGDVVSHYLKVDFNLWHLEDNRQSNIGTLNNVTIALKAVEKNYKKKLNNMKMVNSGQLREHL